MKNLRWIDWLVIAIVGIVVAFILFSIFNFVNKDGIELFSVTSPLVFPFLVGITLLVSWIITIIKDIKDAGSRTRESSKEVLHEVSIAVIYILGVLVYALIIKKIGFIVGSILFLSIIMVFMNYDEVKMLNRVGKAAIVSCVAVPFLYFVFHEVFKVMLP
jgi:uncharacterized membrane protein YhaH (DUF805 family)